MRSSLCACCTPGGLAGSPGSSAAKSLLRRVLGSAASASWSISSSFSSTPSTRCGDRLSTVNGPATRTFACPRRACRRGTRSRPWRRSRRRSPSAARCAASHQSACSFFAVVGPALRRPRAGSPIPPTSCLSAALSCCAQRLKRRLALLPDHVDLGVVGDGLERDVRHALVDEALADVAVRRLRRRCGARDFGFLCWPSGQSASR